MLSDQSHTLSPRSGTRFLGILILLLMISSVLFMTYGVRGSWDFVLMLRGKKLLMLLTVAYAVGVSTLLFQTLTNNNILTPGLMGYDSLYLLLQTLMVFFLGATGFTLLGTVGKFALETPLMLIASILLFRTLNKQSGGDLARLILVGMIFGVMFRSLNSLLQRMLDPAAFTVAQIQYFAQFTSVNVPLLIVGIVVMLISAIWIWRMRYRLDILMLGRHAAIALGLDYVAFSRQVLLWIALLVSVSTALVGPVSFFGLLVCALMNVCAPHLHHRIRIPAVFLTAAIVLVFGQTVFEHLLGMQGVLSVVVEFLGGVVFLWLVLKPQRS
ncbi:iron chelate uptake ABC transporter family permease subunit [Neisseriaceae bacterium ESL0693]|nr:iron chelate uptake ABC transporter family permease subunit [Neisseriaceae bacterium ESL0693]